MTKIILTLSILISSCIASPKSKIQVNYSFTIAKGKVIKENNETILIIPTTLTNNTKDTLSYYSMSCSYNDFYSVDNPSLKVEGSNCDKNIPSILTLAPSHSRKVEIRLILSQGIDNAEIKFKIGFNLLKESKTEGYLSRGLSAMRQKKNIIWSNEISI